MRRSRVGQHFNGVFSHHSTTLVFWLFATFGLWFSLTRNTSFPKFIGWFVSINFTTFLIFAMDKIAAKLNSKRISERTLHVFTLLGGCFGQSFGRSLFHHKSNLRKHPSFSRVQCLSLAIWGGLLWWRYA
mmetsp:Transcript_20017/g.29672  ORF Transcript_20017/g.29672 Transcript_20017/m.29672 type:complete len:130 (+) Transcript_20017:197-586(+)